MRLPSRIAAALVIVALASAPAFAARVGIRGGSGSEPIGDASWYVMGACTDADLSANDYFCFTYFFDPTLYGEGTPYYLNTVVFAFADEMGMYLGDFVESNFSDDEYSLANQNFTDGEFEYPVAVFNTTGTWQIGLGEGNFTHVTAFINRTDLEFWTPQISAIAIATSLAAGGNFTLVFNQPLSRPLPIPGPGPLALLATGLAGVLWRRSGRGRR